MSFSPKIINDPPALKQFFSGETAIKEITKEAKTSFPQKFYYNRWQVVWILATAPFKTLLSLVLECLSAILKCFHAKRASDFLYLLGRHVIRDVIQWFHWTTMKDKFLWPSMNSHRLDSSDYYFQKKLPKEFVNQELQPFIFNRGLKFGLKSGICRGGQLWFAYLYHHTKHLFKDPRSHIIALAKQFEKGVPKEGALLQTFHNPSAQIGKILKDLKMSEYPLATTEEVLHNSSLVIERIKVQPPGFYAIYAHKHAVCYIKIDDKTGFYWDPNKGAIELSAKNQAADLFVHLKESFSNHEIMDPRFPLVFLPITDEQEQLHIKVV